jgi:hypothetical protein
VLADGIANDGVDTTPENNGKNELLVGHASLTRHAACQKMAHFGPSLKSTGVSLEAGREWSRREPSDIDKARKG